MTLGGAVPDNRVMRIRPTSTTPALPAARRRRGVGIVVLAGALVLAGCGSGEDPAATATTEAATAGGDSADPSGGTGSTGGAGSDTAVPSDTAEVDVDVCGAIPASDVQAAVPAADPITAVANDVIPMPTCDYRISIGDGATAMDAAIVSIQLASTDPAYYASQQDLQQDQFDDVTPVEGVDEGFSYNGSGTILMTTDSGVWTIVRGVEVNKEATAQLTADEMAALAQLVEERL
jgi:hypothetical protein